MLVSQRFERDLGSGLLATREAPSPFGTETRGALRRATWPWRTVCRVIAAHVEAALADNSDDLADVFVGNVEDDLHASLSGDETLAAHAGDNPTPAAMDASKNGGPLRAEPVPSSSTYGQ